MSLSFIYQKQISTCVCFMIHKDNFDRTIFLKYTWTNIRKKATNLEYNCSSKIVGKQLVFFILIREIYFLPASTSSFGHYRPSCLTNTYPI